MWPLAAAAGGRWAVDRAAAKAIYSAHYSATESQRQKQKAIAAREHDADVKNCQRQDRCSDGNRNQR